MGTEETTLVDDAASLDEILGKVGDATRRGLWWWPLAVGGAVVLLVGVLIGRISADDGDGSDSDSAAPATSAAVLEAGGLLGGIEGAGLYAADRVPFAWPGQVLTAPTPTAGKAVAWQWELCDGTGTGTGELRCTPVPGATQGSWESPPVDRNRLVRVTVTVDLGGGIALDARSPAVAAVPWPANVSPGDPPPTTSPPTVVPAELVPPPP